MYRRNRKRPLQLPGSGLVLVLLLALPTANLALASEFTVVCCCGEHAGDHDCGCPDCPASENSRSARPDADDDDGLARWAPCRGGQQGGTINAGIDWLTPPVQTSVWPGVRPMISLANTALPPSQILTPESPPS